MKNRVKEIIDTIIAEEKIMNTSLIPTDLYEYLDAMTVKAQDDIDKEKEYRDFIEMHLTTLKKMLNNYLIENIHNGENIYYQIVNTAAEQADAKIKEIKT